MTEKDPSEVIKEFFKKDKSDVVLYNSPVWKSIKNGLEKTGRKIKFRNRGKNPGEINLSGY